MPPGKSTAAFLNTAANILNQFGSGDTEKLGRVWHTVQPWVARFIASTTSKWLPILSREAPCQIGTPDGNGGWTPCVHPAVDLCDCCGKPVCLHHARVDANAGAICFPCVAVARSVARSQRPAGSTQQPPPPPNQGEAKHPPKKKIPREQALAALGLTDPVTEAEIKTTYRKLTLKWHPDKHEAPDKAAATKRFREIQEAFESLKAEK